jgi:uncharacterized membrane protein YeaQ/YmgE (transglycosylase-associated protein family)
MVVLTWIVTGLMVGWSAGLVIKEGVLGLVGDIVIAIIGALLGGWVVVYSLHITAAMYVINLASIVMAFEGAVILLMLLRLLPRGAKSTTS